jgi:hypothetical protein
VYTDFLTGDIQMTTFMCWVRLNQYQTTHVQIHASNSLEARMLAENQYGAGNVINCSQVND